MDIAAARLGLDPAELRRRNLVTDFPHTTAERCRRTTPATTSPASSRRSSSSATTTRRVEQAAGRRLGLGIACVVEPSISNMGYITLAQTPAERAATLPKSGNVEGCILTVGPHGGISVRISSTPQGQGHRTVAAQIVADRLGVTPEDVDGHRRDGHLDERVVRVVRRVLVALQRGGRARRRARSRPRRAPRSRRSASTSARDPSLRRVAGICHWNPSRVPDGHGARGSRPSPTTPPRTSRRRTTTIASRRRRRTASSSTSRWSRSTSAPDRCGCSTT